MCSLEFYASTHTDTHIFTVVVLPLNNLGWCSDENDIANCNTSQHDEHLPGDIELHSTNTYTYVQYTHIMYTHKHTHIYTYTPTQIGVLFSLIPLQVEYGVDICLHECRPSPSYTHRLWRMALRCHWVCSMNDIHTPPYIQPYHMTLEDS